MSNRSDDEPIALSPIDKNLCLKIKQEHDGSKSKLESEPLKVVESFKNISLNDKQSQENINGNNNKDLNNNLSNIKLNSSNKNGNISNTNTFADQKRPNFTRDQTKILNNSNIDKNSSKHTIIKPKANSIKNIKLISNPTSETKLQDNNTKKETTNVEDHKNIKSNLSQNTNSKSYDLRNNKSLNNNFNTPNDKVINDQF